MSKAQGLSEETDLANDSFSLNILLATMKKHDASDLHLKVGRPPLLRVQDRLIPTKSKLLSIEDFNKELLSHLSESQIEKLKKNYQVDCAIEVQNYGRFRINLFYQRGELGCVIRRIKDKPPKLDELNLPTVLKEISTKTSGLFLITGATGSGKTTTMSAIIDYINSLERKCIITLEDPIEYIHKDKKSSVIQREIGVDVGSFKEGLTASLRQDPDVIVVGEIRDKETLEVALSAAETGHFVITTLHTKDSIGAIERMIHFFSHEEHEPIRYQLSSVLVGVLSQTLVHVQNSLKRVPACEVLINSPAVSELIRKNKIEQIYELIESSNTYYQMQTFNQDLERLVLSNVITVDEALKASPQPSNLLLRLEGLKKEEGY
jgi:twitching motility protein PilT